MIGPDLDIKAGFKDFDQRSPKFLEKEACLVFLAVLGPASKGSHGDRLPGGTAKRTNAAVKTDNGVSYLI